VVDSLKFTLFVCPQVYKGLYKGQKVAIKVLKAEDSAVEEEFKKEFKVMSVLESPHVVNFIGACLEPKICMVMEYCSRGTVWHVLNERGAEVAWSKALKFLTEITAGLAYLHYLKPAIFHRDLKTLNILVNESWEVKLTDFGTARFNTIDNKQTLSNMVGTIGWTAPELYREEMFTAKSDVYSLGMIFWEIVTRVIKGRYERPFEEFPELKLDVLILVQSAEHHLRPSIPSGCNSLLAALIQSCWDSNPESRPSSLAVMDQLKAIHQHSQTFPEEWIPGLGLGIGLSLQT